MQPFVAAIGGRAGNNKFGQMVAPCSGLSVQCDKLGEI